MNFRITSVLLATSILVSVAYYAGYSHGKQIQDQLHLRLDLISNVSNYDKLEGGENRAVEDNLVIAIGANVKTYYFYKQKDPYFKEDDGIILKYIEKAEIIEKANSNRIVTIPQ